MQQTDQLVASKPSISPFGIGSATGLPGSRVAYVEASWHAEIVEQARTSFLAELCSLGIPEERVDVFQVPGAFEIPLHALELASTRRYQSIVGCAFVVNGGIYRHDFVAQSVVGALMQVQLETRVPIHSVVLTPHHFHEHEEHQQYFKRHFAVKGKEAAHACVNTICGLTAIAAGR